MKKKNIYKVITIVVLVALIAGCSKWQKNVGQLNVELEDDSETNVEMDYQGKEDETSPTTPTTSTQPIISKNEPVTDSATSNEISFGFLDYQMFDNYLNDGVFKCGSDFTPGDYYIFSLYGAEALYDVSDNPNDFSWSDYRVLRKVSVKKGQYVNIPSGGLLVPCDEVDLKNLNQYGIFVVGEDLKEGDYKITSLTDIYRTELGNIQGIMGAYQISEDSPENEPEDCDELFSKQTYITVKNGQYVTINNAKMVLSE